MLAKGGAVRLAYYCSQVRAAFYERAATSKIATEELTRIAVLYRIGAEIHGRPAGEQHAACQERSWPLIEALEP